MTFLSEFITNIINDIFINILPIEAIYLITMIVKVFLVILLIMICVAYATWLERKIHGLIQRRKGPNVVGPLGLLQPLFDGIKLILKETIIPNNANKFIFLLAPCVTFVVALLGWAVMPIDYGIVFANINIGVLYLLATSSLSVYGLIMAGWASNSQYAFLGAIRSSAQMISYELTMGLVIVGVVLNVGSLNLTNIVIAQQDLWYIVKLLPLAVMFFIVMVAETNRHPFDLPEAESDLVSGYHVEYSGFAFALFFLAEYANMILVSSFFTVLFLGGWLPLLSFSFFQYIPGFVWFMLKVVIILSIMIQLRSVLPRYRYDQLMHLGWKILLPLALFAVMVIAVILRFTNNLPILLH